MAEKRNAARPGGGAGPRGGRSAVLARGIVKTYGEESALAGFDLDVAEGEIHGLLGPNGAGKSTAVNVLTTLTRFDEGNAEVGGFDVRSSGSDVRRSIGLVGQSAAVDEVLGGEQNLVMFARLLGLRIRAAKRRARELLETFGLADAAGRAVSTYSGGMRRRLDIAVSMILDPRVLFLDEPTVGLDPRGRTDVWDAVTGIAARGATVLLTTQYLDEADRLADRISIMKEGAVIAEGTPVDLKRARGGDRIEIVVDDPHAAARLRAEHGMPGDEPTRDGVVTLPAPRGSTDLIEAVRSLDALRIEPNDIALRRPTLDEVFLALTEKERP